MRPDILIVGQGLAGTMLAWEFERAGIAFEIADGGHVHAVSAIAAGIVNPVTGQRFVPTWRFAKWMPLARAAYAELACALGISVWRDLRISRRFADDRERRIFTEKWGRGELRAHMTPGADAGGCWIEGAARVDLPALLTQTRARWQAQGRLHQAVVGDLGAESTRYDLVIDCCGVAGTQAGDFGFVPWEFSKGEILTLAVEGLDPGIILHSGHWLLPVAPGEAWIGATHEPGLLDTQPTPAARATLEASARRLLGDRPFRVTGHTAGVRVNLPDKRPVAGRHPDPALRLGLLNGLGAKGVLYAPALARQWVNHLTEGVPFDPEVAVGRFD
jgi:glycine oxidase